MNIEPRGQLRQGLFALDRSQCHFGFKCRRMIAAGSLRHGSPSFQAISSPVMSGVAAYPVVSRSGASSTSTLARQLLLERNNGCEQKVLKSIHSPTNAQAFFKVMA